MRASTDNPEALSFQEIADELGVSRPVVQVIYHRAIRKIKDDPKLRAYWEDMLEPRSLDSVLPE
jgi:DNA-directed RNA polymerase sigma subunit (sigma70/sigma32)